MEGLKYRFDTTATMKEYNCKKWWIDSKVVQPITVEAVSLVEALEQWRRTIKERFDVRISDSAMTSKSPMYVDRVNAEPEQVGYVITGSTDFLSGTTFVKQYIDLWVTISEVKSPFA